MCNVLKTLWLRIQEEPLELTIAFVGVLAAAVNMSGRNGSLSMFAWFFYAFLLFGGIGCFHGRLADNLSLESAGIALLVGGYSFSTLRGFARAHSWVDYTTLTLYVAAIAGGLIVRLVVVRKAVRARGLVARGKQ